MIPRELFLVETESPLTCKFVECQWTVRNFFENTNIYRSSGNNCLTSVFGAWSFIVASFTSSRIYRAKLASKRTTSKICFPRSKNVLLAIGQNVLAENEMFEKFDGGEMSKQGHIAETIPCCGNKVGHYRQALLCKITR